LKTRDNITPIILILFCLLCGPALSKEKPKDPTGPNRDLTKEIDFERMSTFQLGPIGARGWMYVNRQMTKKARQILITEVDEGLPAAGILQVGDVILGAGGKRFDDDARKCLGKAIDEAEKEENKGILKLTRWRPIKDAKPRKGKETEVELKLRVMGTYSDTAPWNCPKSKKIMEEALVHVMDRAKNGKFGKLGESLLALMAVGKPECMEIVRKAIHSAKWASPDLHVSVDSGGAAGDQGRRD